VEGKRLRGKEKTLARKRAMTARALQDCSAWLGAIRDIRAAE
jgi:methylenetetrahydrofolate--tRNA-(uracil-5-)-methyltransferase